MRRGSATPLAVALGGRVGGGANSRWLMVPIVHITDELGLQDTATAIKQLATKAKDGKSKSDERAGVTFTASNPGVCGVKQFGVIMTPPQGIHFGNGHGGAGVLSAPDSGFETLCYISVTLS